jgi:uncharacterized membrane protein
MGNLPLHPLIVHFPLVLAVLLPIPVLIMIVRHFRGRPLTARVWAPVTAWALLLAVSAFAAVQTGQEDEERVEEVVPHSAFETHEDRAEVFMRVTFVFAVLAIAVPLVGEKWRRPAAFTALVGSLLVTGLAFGVGHSGGTLVYRHNAASAYAAGSTTEQAREITRTERPRREHDDDGDRDHGGR